MRLEHYTIRRCQKEEYPALIRFIHDHWSENHIFCKSRAIFEFQHGSASGGYYDFIIAVHRESGEIHAVLGYISFSTYDKGSIEQPVAVSGALWKVREDVQGPEVGKLGLGLLYYLLQSFPHSAYVTLGLSADSQSVYQALHFQFGLMGHYYVAAAHMSDFKLIEHPVRM
ncbi:MAG: hypothetical protein IJ228_08640 [Succinivibrio sp.]|nr:hypothetical protein [Succinivibrio sp.]